jgi:hypothetical protein
MEVDGAGPAKAGTVTASGIVSIALLGSFVSSFFGNIIFSASQLFC